MDKEQDAAVYVTITTARRALTAAIDSLKVSSASMHDRAIKMTDPEKASTLRGFADELDACAEGIKEALRHVERYSSEPPKYRDRH